MESSSICIKNRSNWSTKTNDRGSFCTCQSIKYQEILTLFIVSEDVIDFSKVNVEKLKRDTVGLNTFESTKEHFTKYEKLRPDVKPFGNLTENEVGAKLAEMAKEVKSNLSNNGFTVPKENVR